MTELTAPARIDDDGSAVIQREAVYSIKHAETGDQAVAIYEVSRTAEVISQGNFKRIALQFPDDLLADSTAVSEELKRRISSDAQLFILADTSYGSCCVDEVASEHYSADLIVHYGRTCLSLTSRIPVFYVFGREPVSVQDCVEKASKSLEGRSILLMYDVPYAYMADEIAKGLRLAEKFERVVESNITAADRAYVPGGSGAGGHGGMQESKPCGGSCCGGCDKTKEEDSRTADPVVAATTTTIDTIDTTTVDRAETADIKPGRSFELAEGTAIGDYTILYIGGESHTLTNLMVTLRSQAVFSYDPRSEALREETGKVNKHLNKRYFMVQKAKDADVIGIVVGTLAATRYLHVVESLKKMIRSAQKKFYVFVVGKLNVPKLANFAEIDVFVLVACPENSLVDSKEFYRPIVTPYELELALSRTKEWTGDYVTDFHEFLEQAEKRDEQQEEQNGGDGDGASELDEDRPHFSLVTGTYKQSKKFINPSDSEQQQKLLAEGMSDMVLRNKNTEIARYLGSAGADPPAMSTYNQGDVDTKPEHWDGPGAAEEAAGLEKADQFNEDEEDDDSPFEMVRIAVSNKDDSDLPVLTFRSWVLGIFFAAALSFVNQFYWFRELQVSLNSSVVQILSFPLGYLMARFLPTRKFRTFGWEWSFNPGPFNIKEHVLITMFSVTATGSAYAIDVVTIKKMWYETDLGFGASYLFLLTTQMLGYSFAGFARRFLVYPAAMIWPSTLIMCTLFRTFHEIQSFGGKFSRTAIFWIAFIASFVWYFIPGYAFPVLSMIPILCIAAPNNVIAHQLGDGSNGLGMLNFTLDWATVASYMGSPISYPWVMACNLFTGFVIIMWIATPAGYYANTWNTGIYPIYTPGLFLANGSKYKMGNIMTADQKIDPAKYDSYGHLRMTYHFAMTYGIGFAAVIALLVYIALHHGKDILQRVRQSRSFDEDIHMRLMRKYPEVPLWWYGVIFVVMFAVSVVTCEVFHLMPWYWFILSVVIPFIFTIPIGIIQAISNQQP
ncbi:hypothetical protein GGI12_002063, partial [Dipsacomyces acuminosporus]